jgi:hypothetical protein
MAISVDTVYQRVLALANKEQRGYITPQEFNLLANQAQMSIFESYFYAKNQRDRAEPARTNEIDESDIGELLDRKLGPFQSFLPVTSGHTFPATVDVTSPSATLDIFQYGVVMLGDEPCQKVSMFDAQRLKKSTRHMLSTADQAPIYTDNRVSGRDIVVYAGSTNEETSSVTVECFRVPRTAEWTYVVVNSKALYNASIATNFELHRSEEDTLVYDILALAGIVMNKPGLAQTASQIGIGEQQIQNT